MNMQLVLDSLFSVLQKENILCIYLYGNINGNDVDLFVVLKNNEQYDTFRHGALDVTMVGQKQLDIMLKYYDPLATEPMLTGRLVYGKYPLTITKCINGRCDQFTPEYLMQYAELFYGWACSLVIGNRIYDGIQTIGFSYSYILFATHYNKGGSLVTFSEVKKQDSANVLPLIKKAKNRKLLDSEIYTIFRCVKLHLTDTEIILGFLM